LSPHRDGLGIQNRPESIVPALSKSFDILTKVIAHQREGISLSEIVHSNRLPKSSAYRILKTLTHLGYISFDPDTSKYKPTLKIAALGSQILENFDLKSRVRPYLLEVAREIGHTCNLVILDEDMAVFLDKIEVEEYGIKLFSTPGKRAPLHCTAVGKVLLASMPSEKRKQILSRGLPELTPNTITDPRKLEKELQDVLQRGFAVDREEITRGIMCIASPIRNPNGEVIAAFSITFPSFIAQEEGLERLQEEVKRYAGKISREIGGSR
jgi:DNA-binding IclR family transcriptional regulator